MSKDLLTGHQSGCGPDTTANTPVIFSSPKSLNSSTCVVINLQNYKIQPISGHVSLLYIAEVADSFVRRQLYFAGIFNQSLETFILFFAKLIKF